jgi:hypothetical protein
MKTTEEYLAGIRRTIAESKRMMESVKLRFAETDRMLEESGTSREEVMKMRFSREQRVAVNEAQTDMTRLQSLVDRRDESYSTATNLMTSISDTRSNVIRNM